MAENSPAWGYRLAKDGTVEAQLFSDGKLPKGWKDTPAGLEK